MNSIVWILLFAAGALAIYFAGRLAVVHSDIVETAESFTKRVEEDWNAPITTGSGDRYVKELVRRLNDSLIVYRETRRRREQDDTHLRDKITNLAHDLRTPLTAVMGYLDVLEDQPDAASRYLPIMRNRIELMAALTGELFEYSLSSSGRPVRIQESIDLRSLIENAVISLYPVFQEHSTEPQLDLPEMPVLCSTDRSLAERLYGNILTNAIRHGSGRIRVKLDEDGTVIISNAAPDLDPLDIEKMFDRFYTVRNAGRTTGLGLGIAKTLAEELGGSVQASLSDGILEIIVSLPCGSLADDTM